MMYIYIIIIIKMGPNYVKRDEAGVMSHLIHSCKISCRGLGSRLVALEIYCNNSRLQ